MNEKKRQKKTEQFGDTTQLKHGWVLTVIFSIISIIFISPIFIVLMNSFKQKSFINLQPFSFPQNETFVKLENYARGIEQIGFFDAFKNSLIITILSVAAIILCTSMCAWYIARVNSKGTNFLYMLCLFSMIVPFQMVMFTLSKIADMLGLTNPLGIVIVYLGFGAGLAVFMFVGFVKSIPLEIEEAAMIDGCNPIQTYFQVVLPILKPTCITVAILQAMWVWNDYGIQDNSDCNPVSERRIWFCRLGCDDGYVSACNYSNCYFLYGMPEAHYKRSCCRSGERII